MLGTGGHIAHLQQFQFLHAFQQRKETNSRREVPSLPRSAEPGEGRRQPSPAAPAAAALDVLHSHLRSLPPFRDFLSAS